MRWREAMVVAAAMALTTGACSRLTFVKPDPNRKGMTRTAPEYDLRETRVGRQRATVRHLIASSELKLQAGDVAGAREDADAAMRIDRNSAKPHTMLAVIAELQGDQAAAGRHHAQAAKLEPGSGAALNNYGAWLCANGRASESLSWFERALGDPAHLSQRTSTLANAGACALQAGRAEDAELYLATALEMDPAQPLALLHTARLRLQQQRPFEARAFIERRLAAAPASEEALRTGALIERQLGDTVAADLYVQRLREEFPSTADAIPPGEVVQP